MGPFEIFAQALGFIGAGIYIFSFQIRDVKKLFIFQSLGAVFFTVHFILLGAYTGALQNSLAILRGIILLVHGKKWASSKFTLAGLILLFIVSGIITYSGPLGLLPMIAMIVSTIAMWTHDGFKIRVTQLAATSPFWLIYNVSVMSVSGIITETFNIISVIISFIRYGKHYDS